MDGINGAPSSTASLWFCEVHAAAEESSKTLVPHVQTRLCPCGRCQPELSGTSHYSDSDFEPVPGERHELEDMFSVMAFVPSPSSQSRWWSSKAQQSVHSEKKSHPDPVYSQLLLTWPTHTLCCPTLSPRR